MARTRVETRARARALQALYAWDMRGGDNKTLERVTTQVWDDLGISPEERRVAGPIMRLVAQKQRELDLDLADVTTNWRLERIGAVERCVLRLAAAELTIGDTPPRVVIQEAVILAERYGSEQSAKFVNGVLDALARRMGRM
ncbi:MAG: utilization substance protein B-like protein [Gemmatimonadetes bacterium]|jgi:N utilization substance protein B|nr:utilization substance protein B-like protein [Gemmatimonadota bacterium]